MAIIFRGTMVSASQSLFLLIVFRFIMTGTLSHSSALSVSIPDAYTYATTGQTKSMECKVSGLSVSSVTWSHGNTFLTVGEKYFWTYNPSSGRADLIVYRITEADAGTYECLAQNTAGVRVRDTLVLTVEDKLSVTISTVADGIVGLGITIPCAVTGRPINTVQWSFNGIRLTKSSPYSWNTGAKADLYISVLTLENIGTYTCMASNHASSQLASVYLTVKSMPIVTILSNKPDFGIVGQAKTLSCNVLWTSVSTVTWYNNGIPLTISSKYTWTNNLISGPADLTISTLLKSDSGIYTCAARSNVGTYSDAVNLTAEDVLHVVVPYVTETGIVGHVKTLQCSITGSPITHVSWSFNGYTLTNNKLKHYWPTSSTPNLDIENLAITDAGMYECSASNDVGTSYASINLVVIARPVVTIGNSKQLVVNEGKSVLIPCVVTETTTIDSLQWYFQNKFLCHSDPHVSWSNARAVSFPFDCSLRINNVIPQDTGAFKCQATNTAGVGEDSIDLLVQDRDSPGSAESNICHEDDRNSPGSANSDTCHEDEYMYATVGLAVIDAVFLLVILSWRMYKCCN